MEHIGSRKIMASQSERGLGGDTLRHLAEETRHAYFFKRAAEKLAHRPLGYGAAETIAGAAARVLHGTAGRGASLRELDGAAEAPCPISTCR